MCDPCLTPALAHQRMHPRDGHGPSQHRQPGTVLGTSDVGLPRCWADSAVLGPRRMGRRGVADRRELHDVQPFACPAPLQTSRSTEPRQLKPLGSANQLQLLRSLRPGPWYAAFQKLRGTAEEFAKDLPPTAARLFLAARKITKVLRRCRLPTERFHKLREGWTCSENRCLCAYSTSAIQLDLRGTRSRRF